MKEKATRASNDHRKNLSSVGKDNVYSLVRDICDYIRSDPSGNVSLSDLEKRFKVSRFIIQKTFKVVMGISPRKYTEECRILLLKRNLKDDEPIPLAVYKTGYNSQSWLYENSSSKLGMKPSSYRKGGEGATIDFLTSKCKLGYLLVAQTEHGICSVSIADREDQLISYLHEEYPRAEIRRSKEVSRNLSSVLEYFEGQLLNLPVDIAGTEFQKRVWSAIMKIPYGQTRTYNQIAEAIEKPKAVRAVGNACAANPVPLIIPCHRVVRKDGGLGGYGLGPKRKEFMLSMEKENKKVK